MISFRSFPDPVLAVVRPMLPLLLLSGFSAMAAADDRVVSLIPKPARVRTGEGVFTMTPKTKVLVEQGSAAVEGIGRRLAEKLAATTGYDVRVETFDGEKTSGGIVLMTTLGANQTRGTEGYRLTVTPDHVLVRAMEPAGLFYGVQTLYQLLPPEIENPKRSDSVAWTIPAVEIEDRPRFAWRGMHLDVARHFFPKEFVKEYIDLLASYKINTFHLYLTDDQGWRIDIKRYPRLTEIGAWRQGTVMHQRGGQACLWTEYVPTPADVEYLLFPRLFAMAEALWSPKDRPPDEEFFKRVAIGLDRLDFAGVNHYPIKEAMTRR